MKIKVGDIVKNAVLTSKLSKGDILAKMNKSYPWLNTVLEDDYMQAKYIEQFGVVLGIDFKQVIPDLKKVIKNSTVEEPREVYGEMNNIELRNNMIEVQAKYIKLLEQHVKLLEEFKQQKK